MKAVFFLLGLIPLLVINSVAQWPDGGSPDSQRQSGFTVHGQVLSSSNILLGSLSVELVANGHTISQSTSLGADGAFEFHSIAPGSYELQITGAGGSVIYRERVFITGPNQPLTISVPWKGSADRSAGATISAAQLWHKPPAQAQKEYSKGQAAARKGDHRAAADFFQKAVDIDPEFADAHNNLGSAQVSLGDLEQAAGQFQKAIDLAPDHTVAIANLSIVLSRLKRFEEAGEAARRALRLDPSLLKIRYILALSLIRRPGHEAEALENLQRAAAEIPKAHLVAADILSHDGKLADAAKQLEQYLRDSPAHDTDRAKVEEWLAQLRRP